MNRTMYTIARLPLLIAAICCLLLPAAVQAANPGSSLLVPLRFVSETMGAKVAWNAVNYSVDITLAL